MRRKNRPDASLSNPAEVLMDEWSTPCGPGCPPDCRPGTPHAARRHLEGIRRAVAPVLRAAA